MGDRYVTSVGKKKILYIDANNLYGHSMSQPVAYQKIKFGKIVKLEDILNTLDDSDIGNFIKVDLKYPDTIRRKTANFPICPVNESMSKDKFSKPMKKLKSDNYTQPRKSICDWTDKKIFDPLQDVEVLFETGGNI